jgi:hypothetical protein
LPQEQDPDRKAAMHAIRDTRVDVCLYFIPPHRMRQVGGVVATSACRVHVCTQKFVAVVSWCEVSGTAQPWQEQGQVNWALEHKRQLKDFRAFYDCFTLQVT